MRPLHSIDYLSITNIETIIDVLIGQVEFIGAEAVSTENLDYDQLKRNIDYMKTGFERIETLVNQNAK